MNLENHKKRGLIIKFLDNKILVYHEYAIVSHIVKCPYLENRSPLASEPKSALKTPTSQVSK